MPSEPQKEEGNKTEANYHKCAADLLGVACRLKYEKTQVSEQQTVTIPSEIWKKTLIKVDELKAENERLRKIIATSPIATLNLEKAEGRFPCNTIE